MEERSTRYPPSSRTNNRPYRPNYSRRGRGQPKNRQPVQSQGGENVSATTPPQSLIQQPLLQSPNTDANNTHHGRKNDQSGAQPDLAPSVQMLFDSVKHPTSSQPSHTEAEPNVRSEASTPAKKVLQRPRRQKSDEPQRELVSRASDELHRATPLSLFKDNLIAQKGEGFIKDLERETIYVLKKKSARFPQAHFFCRICGYHMDNELVLKEHRDNESHSRKIKIQEDERIMKNIPEPTPNHLTALSVFLDDTYTDIALEGAEATMRSEVVEKLADTIRNSSEEYKDVGVDICGSVLASLATKHSNTNIRLTLPTDLSPSDAFNTILRLINTTGFVPVVKVDHDFQCRTPHISFTVKALPDVDFVVMISEDANKISNLVYQWYSCHYPLVQKVATLFKHLAKLCNMAGGDANATLPPYCYHVMAIYYCQRMFYCPALLDDMSLEGKSIDEVQKLISSYQIRDSFTPSPEPSIGEVWLKLLKFYSSDFDAEVLIISIMNSRSVLKSERSRSNKRPFVEDPGIPRKNIAKSASHSLVADYISNKFRSGFLYFSIPQLDTGPAFTTITPYINSASQGDQVDGDGVAALTSQVKSLKVNSVLTDGDCKDGVEKSYDQDLVDNLKVEEFNFTMDKDTFPLSGDTPPMACWSCNELGHLANACPKETQPEIEELSPPSAEHSDLLSSVLVRIRDQNQMTAEDFQKRNEVMDKLHNCLCCRFPEVNLKLFGSSRNGFGFPKSDLDICMTLNDRLGMDANEMTSVINEVTRLLQDLPDFADILPITTAKVPIMKFCYKKYDLSGDVSLYNVLAQRNTDMLLRYGQIDERMRTLGYTVKEFAKTVDICDASRGSFSSYAYILMMIHYLQQCDPPVLPVLQEMYTGENKPQNWVEGRNTWFYDCDNDQLAKDWDGYKRNTQSEGELWIGFLDYYTQIFDTKNNVVCIRQLKPLTKFDKLWNSPTLAIEDPFNLQHNLGLAAVKDVYRYIMKVIVRARKVFRTPFELAPDQSAYNHFFNRSKLTNDEEYPVSGCHDCGKITHQAKSCPTRIERDRKRRSDAARRRHNADMRNRQQPACSFPDINDPSWRRPVHVVTPQQHDVMQSAPLRHGAAAYYPPQFDQPMYDVPMPQNVPQQCPIAPFESVEQMEEIYRQQQMNVEARQQEFRNAQMMNNYNYSQPQVFTNSLPYQSSFPPLPGYPTQGQL